MVVALGNQDTGHTLEVVGLPLVECKVGVGLGMLLQQGKVEAYLPERDRVLLQKDT